MQGLDVEAKAELLTNLNFTAAYSYLDAEIADDGVTPNAGSTPSFVPEQLASLWVDYTLPGAGGRGDMTFGLGARYGDAYFFDDANTEEADSRIIVDAAYRYQVRDDVELAVNVDNLFDEKYVAHGGFGADLYNPGREVSATLRYDW